MRDSQTLIRKFNKAMYSWSMSAIKKITIWQLNNDNSDSNKTKERAREKIHAIVFILYFRVNVTAVIMTDVFD